MDRRAFICSCGFTRETISDWAANAVSKLHKQLGPAGVEHVTRPEAPDDSKGSKQLTLIVATQPRRRRHSCAGAVVGSGRRRARARVPDRSPAQLAHRMNRWVAPSKPIEASATEEVYL